MLTNEICYFGIFTVQNRELIFLEQILFPRDVFSVFFNNWNTDSEGYDQRNYRNDYDNDFLLHGCSYNE